jgi:hypothetical protein
VTGTIRLLRQPGEQWAAGLQRVQEQIRDPNHRFLLELPDGRWASVLIAGILDDGETLDVLGGRLVDRPAIAESLGW